MAAVKEIILLLLSTYSLLQSVLAIVSIEDNGYRGLVVAIHNSVVEDPVIVENLKSLFTSASKSLYKATNQRAYFHEVIIVVPKEWATRPDFSPTTGGNRFSTADVRIDRSNPEYGNNPYTMQPGSCGEPGQYIHLTDEFIKDLHGSTKEEYGDLGNTFVHEWAHLRYGVFDEYGDQEDYRTPSFYVDDENMVRPTGCGNSIPGWLEDEAAQILCRAGPDGLPDENCNFIPDSENNDMPASLMYMHWLPSAEGFCGDSFPHNSAAPNKQNLLCSGQSTWEVISQHPDFLGDSNPTRTGLDTAPLFRVLQPPKNEGGQYMLVLDISGSMSGRRINMLHRAAAHFVKDQIPERSRLGIVSFSTEPHVLSDITLITQETRRSLLEQLPRKDDGGNTGIGLALQFALQMLEKRNATEGAVIILITDGEENVPPRLSEVMQEILRSRVTINTIAFGSEASKHLEKLVRLTGGKGYFYSDEEIEINQAIALQAAFFAAASTQADVDIQPVEVSNRVLYVDPAVVKSGHVVIDKAIGQNTNFLFANSYTDMLNIKLISPDNEVYDRTSREYLNDPVTKSITFIIPQAKPGKWNYTIESVNPQRQGVGISVTSEPKDIRRQPIRIRAWINDVEFNFPQGASKAKIFAEVKKKYSPIVGATVFATVERPVGTAVELELHDNGAGADTVKDDGVYSAYFTQFNSEGRYSVAARVINDGKARLKIKQRRNKKKDGAMKMRARRQSDMNQPAAVSFPPDELGPPLPESEIDYLEEPVDDFERANLAGAFRLQKWEPGDFIPPNRVTDLQVEELFISNLTVSLSWTAPGDDMDSGNATKTELRFHPKAQYIWHKFNESLRITEDDIINGTLSPPASGQRHHITVNISNNFNASDLEGSTLFFALRCYDDGENAADVSNVAFAYFSIPYVEKEINRTLPASQATLLIACGMVSLIFIIIVIMVALHARHRRQHCKKMRA